MTSKSKMDGFFGFMANAAALCITQPIDTIKTRFQVRPDSTVSEVARGIYANHGARGFYAGLTPNLATYPIFWAAFFGSNQVMKDVTVSENRHVDKFCKYYTSGMIGSAIANPLFVLKIRSQNTCAPIREVVRQVEQTGYRTYYRGLGATYINNLKLGIQFPLYDLFKDRTQSVALSSFGAKTVSSAVLYPFELIRTQQRGATTDLTIRQTAANIYQHSGIRGFYRGLVLYNLVTTPNFVIMMLGMEFMRSQFGKRS